MGPEWDTLDSITKSAVLFVIGECQQAGEMCRRPYGKNGEVYAYPRGREGIAWGVNGTNGFNIARGIKR
jgi:hypothetical protein